MSADESKKKLSIYAGLREIINEKGITNAFKLARVYGYDGAELLFIANECESILDHSEEFQIAINESSIPVVCISCYAKVVSDDIPYTIDRTTVEAIKRCIDLSHKIDCHLVHHTLVPRLTGGRENYSQVLPVAIEAASEIVNYAKERNIIVLYEPQGMLFNGRDGYSAFFDTMASRHSNIGMCLDIGNTLWVDEDCYELAEKYASYVKHVHVKDYVLDSEDKTYRTLGNRTIKEVKLGSGIIDITRVLGILSDAGYQDFISVEDNSSSNYEDIANNAIALLNEQPTK